MNLWFDFKYGWRLLLRSPLHSLLCAIVVALSVGLALFFYVMNYSNLWKPLPFAGSERWISVQIAPNATATAQARVDAYTYQQLLERTTAVEHLGAFGERQAVISEGQASTKLRAAVISPALLSVLKVAPAMGRLFDATDGQPGAAQAVLLGFATWQNYFAGDPAVVGKTTQIDGRPARIVGVMPEDFYAFQDHELWLPLHLEPIARPADSPLVLAPLVVLKEGRSSEAAQREMDTVVQDLNRTYPQIFDTGRHVRLIPAHRMWGHSRVQVLTMASFIAVAVLLLGCLNISLIFFARLLERRRELALRTAVGSARGRLLRQALVEGFFVVLFGLALGIFLAQLGILWVQGLQDVPAQILATGRQPHYPMLRAVDLLVAVAAATAVWLLSTLIPAWRITKQDPAAVLAGSGKGATGSRGSMRTAGLLVGLQVLISSVLLVICANVVFAVRDELNKPSGVKTERVMVSTYPTTFDARHPDGASRQRYWEELATAIKNRVSGAEVAYSTVVPTRPVGVPAAIEDLEGAASQATLSLPLSAVSEGYFELLGIALRSGRLFDSTDDATSMGVVVVDEHTAQRYWPQQDVLGKRIQLSPGEDGPWLTVVGVVSAVAGAPYSRNVGGLYRPLRQAAPEAFHLVVRLPASTAAAKAALREAAHAVDRDLPLHNLQLIDDVLYAMNGFKSMVPGFAGVALITFLLAAVGLIGLITRSVAQRTQEVGIRRALGSTSWQVIGLFVRQGIVYLSVGLLGGALGIAMTTLLTRSIPNVLAHVVPATAGVLALMSVVVFAACTLPARRAVALEPGDALRYE